jgi:hypothetical protein
MLSKKTGVAPHTVQTIRRPNDGTDRSSAKPFTFMTAW